VQYILHIMDIETCKLSIACVLVFMFIPTKILRITAVALVSVISIIVYLCTYISTGSKAFFCIKFYQSKATFGYIICILPSLNVNAFCRHFFSSFYSASLVKAAIIYLAYKLNCG